jgi:nucleoid-associated protein YgaU
MPNAMTREHKLALIFGFALVLVVGLLISDNFSASRKSEPGGPAVAESQQPLVKEEILLAGGNTAKPTVSTPAPSITDPTSGGAPLGGEPVSQPSTFVMGTNQPAGGLGERLETAWHESIEELKGGQISTGAAAQTEGVSTLTQPTAMPTEPKAGLHTPTSDSPFVTPAPSPVPVKGNVLGGGPGSNLTPLGGDNRETKPLEPHESAPTTSTETTSKDKTHQIVDGDSFWKIAKKHYNDGSLADALKAYNKNRIGKNGQLRVGASLLIPEKSVLKGGSAAPAVANAETKPEKKSDLKVPSKENLEKIAKGGKGEAKPEMKAEAKPESMKKGAATTYTVKSGDTLEKIAVKFLGSASRVSDILNANSSILDNEDDVQVGQKLKIPAR